MTEKVNLDKVTRQINYLSKDFDAYRNDFIEYIKRYYPDEWQDFSEASPGMALLDLIAYLGDSLTYLLDRQVNECFLDRAVEEKNLMNLCQNMGYKPKSVSPSLVDISVSATFFDTVSASTLFKLSKGMQVGTSSGKNIVFETIDEINFSSSENRTTKQLGDGRTEYSISGIRAIAGTTRTFSFTAPDTPIPFYNLKIPDKEITEIISVTSSDGNEWYEVNNLAEEIIFYGEENKTSTSGDVSHILKYKKIPRRFFKKVDENGGISITFGSGVSNTEDYNIIPNPEDFVLPPNLRGSVSGFSPSYIDSSNFLRTNSLGISPSKTSLTVEYRVGGGLNTNVPSRSINRILNRNIVFEDLNSIQNFGYEVEQQLKTLQCININPATGGREKESIDSIKNNAIAFFNSQGRVITLQDYQVRCMSMPSEYGRPFRVYARKNTNNNLGVELVVLGLNSEGKISTLNGIIKNNIESYIKRFKSFSDTINIVDGKIVNIAIDFTIVPNPNFDKSECIVEGLNIVKDSLKTSLTNFNDNIVISDLIYKIQSSNKIYSVSNMKILNRYGVFSNKNYSNYSFNITSNTINGVLSFPEDVLWEVKYPNSDIICRLA